MDFIKLPANSEKLLLELLQADNPVQMLGVRFEQASQRDDDELRGMLRELRDRHLSETMMNCAVCLENCAKEDISMCSGQIMYPTTLH